MANKIGKNNSVMGDVEKIDKDRIKLFLHPMRQENQASHDWNHLHKKCDKMVGSLLTPPALLCFTRA